MDDNKQTHQKEAPIIEKWRILHSLYDLRGKNLMPLPILATICELNDWNMEECRNILKNDTKAGGNRQAEMVAVTSNTSLKNPEQWYHILKDAYRKYEEHSSEFDPEVKIEKYIKSGLRVMIIMRGAPGSGKSHMAKSLVNRMFPDQLACNLYKPEQFILSTDDFFYNSRGDYNFRKDLLSDNHSKNHSRVAKKASEGWSPIVVDNTNMRQWEMEPYVRIGLRYGYHIEILEPTTPWCKSAGRLTERNSHGVTKEQIQKMLNGYEKINIRLLVESEEKRGMTTMPRPQLREIPKLEFEEFGQADVYEDDSWATYEDQQTGKPKPQRSKRRVVNAVETTSEADKLFPQYTHGTWLTYNREEEDTFWDLTNNSQNKVTDKPQEAHSESMAESFIKHLRDKEGNNKESETNLEKSPVPLLSHKPGCRNEHQLFALLRQIYPNKHVDGLWHLFTCCEGDIDWALDVLIKEEESKRRTNGNEDDEDSTSSLDNTTLNCNCDIDEQGQIVNESFDIGTGKGRHNDLNKVNDNIPNAQLPQRSKSSTTIRCQQQKQPKPLQFQQAKEAIYNRVVMADEFNHHKNRREMARGRKIDNETQTDLSLAVRVEDNEEDDEDSIDDANAMIEVKMTGDIIEQLGLAFQGEIELSLESQALSAARLSQNQVNVFMPRSLAKELYLLCMESIFNQMEEQRLEVIKEDENFAKLINNPKYADYMEAPGNLIDLLDMEMAWEMYKDEEETIRNEAKRHEARDLAMLLTQKKLCEEFPQLPKETLLDVLLAHDNDFGRTVDVLRNNLNCEPKGASTLAVVNTQQSLLELAKKENQYLQSQQYNVTNNNKQFPATSPSTSIVPSSSNSTPEVQKQFALLKFEESRNMAAHHCQLKAECYRKATEAIQRGNRSVGLYYSEVAKLHRKKVDMYNQHAANCIMDVHMLTQNNTELLDLHYLHVIEAISCLDVFLDRHINALRASGRNCRFVFIITGRGLHSAGGVSTIKNRVKARLKERSIRWSEVNPGLLKVRIFPSTKYSELIG